MIYKYLYKSSNMEEKIEFTDDLTKYQKICRFLFRILYPEKYYRELYKDIYDPQIECLKDQIKWYKNQIDNVLRCYHNKE